MSVGPVVWLAKALGEAVTVALRDLLDRYRSNAASEREKGDYFERLVRVWLQHSPTQAGQYSRVIPYSEWAAERFASKQDTGIDLCAELADAPGQWCGIQCRFYRLGHRFQLKEISTFISATDREPFVRRVFVDTTGAQWSEHAEEAYFNSRLESKRIGLQDLEDSGIDWAAFADSGKVALLDKKQPRQHQREALQCVRDGLAEADRGKLIMACGTGKTFTALKIAEDVAGAGGRVLFLVPSLALMSQTVREWSIDSSIPLRSFAVCSDVQVGIRKSRSDDLGDIDQHDLEIPATTRANVIAAKATAAAPNKMTVIFSTYHSLAAIAEAQKNYGLPEFDLIICDEAHRTTGVTLVGEDESSFVKIHDGGYIVGKKRLYMTATPRVYGEAVTQAAAEQDATLCSMDDEALFGRTLFTRNFGWAVQNGLLCDYKVIVLAVDESSVSASIQARLSDENSELKLDDATKLVGCYKALLKDGAAPDVGGDTQPMRRAIAFARSIEASKLVANEFSTVASQWREAMPSEQSNALPELDISVRHVDGTFNAKSRDELLAWIKDDTGQTDECRILTNARCLSEGVDVPALDGILFLHPRKSQVDVVQAVGRVMRIAPGKRMGYVILPVGVPAGMEPEEVLNNNERYKVIWQILNALRSHDERLDGTINKIGLGVDPGGRIEIIPVTNSLPTRSGSKGTQIGIGAGSDAGDDGEPGNSTPKPIEPTQTAFQFDEFSRALLARIVKKCGTRTYWEDWAKDVARIAEIHITRIRAAVSVEGSDESAAFAAFLAEIRDDLNDSITADEAIEMLAQHMITKPVFDALFEGYSFAANNPVSKALEGVLGVLDKQHLEKEAEGLERFYNSIRIRAAGITDASAKQKIVVELYDKFFRNAFPRMTERLGIVYTPVEVVDFIIHSVNEVLQSEFGQTLGSKGVHIMDPFTGTGTFITRLLQSGLIKPEELEHKYRHEIHANEIVLLAYYIAAINIEATYHSLTGGEYRPFEGICLTDTFQLYEQERDMISDLMTDNSNRRTRQKELDIRVIVGNPPYSVGQGSANDNAANVAYPKLDGRIRQTYAARSTGNPRSLYDSYIRAIRWASDRIGNAGVVAYVSNAGWLAGAAADGFRQCLVEEFASIHVFHLRGNARTSGEIRRKEKDNVFGQGTRTPVAILLLVKNPAAEQHGKIRVHDVGDYLTREEKLAIVARFGSIGGVADANAWQDIAPNQHGDWLGQRDQTFEAFLPIGDKDNKTATTLFANYSRGVETGRDAWCYNGSRDLMASNMRAMIAFYNSELARFEAVYGDASRKAREEAVNSFIDTDPKNISWSYWLKGDLAKGHKFEFCEEGVSPGLYRPFNVSGSILTATLTTLFIRCPAYFRWVVCKITGSSAFRTRGRIAPFPLSWPTLSLICISSTGANVSPAICMTVRLIQLPLRPK
jgi:predicted helicase